MTLTDEQKRIFRRTIVDLQKEGNFYKTTTLYALYKDNYFVTERFGTTLSLCKCVGNQCGGNHFTNSFLRFKTPVDLSYFDTLWLTVEEEQYAKYKGYLLGERRRP